MPECQGHLDALTDSADDVTESSFGSEIGSKQDPTLRAVIARLREQPSPISTSSPSEDPIRGEGIGARLGHYEILKKIGSGASERVYRALDTRLDRWVVIKVFRESLAETESGRQRLVREARSAAALIHDHVVQVFEIVSDESAPPHIVYEWVGGKTLEKRLDRDGPLPSGEAARIAREIASGLAAAHQKGLVYRDIKPSNILLDAVSGRTKVTDFGLARSDDEQQSRLTMDGQLAGTPAFMSPEQILSPSQVDGRTDVYSLGTILFQMLTGELPFRGVTRMMLMQVLHEDPPEIRSLNDAVPRDLETICNKAMEKEPFRRYESATEMVADLERFEGSEPIKARPISIVEREWRYVKRNPRLSLWAAAIVFLLAAVAVVSLIAAVWEH